MNLYAEQICQEQEQDRKINQEEYFPKHHPASVVPLYRITESPDGWIAISQPPRRKQVELCAPEGPAREVTGSSHTRAHLSLHFNGKLEQD